MRVTYLGPVDVLRLPDRKTPIRRNEPTDLDARSVERLTQGGHRFYTHIEDTPAKRPRSTRSRKKAGAKTAAETAATTAGDEPARPVAKDNDQPQE